MAWIGKVRVQSAGMIALLSGLLMQPAHGRNNAVDIIIAVDNSGSMIQDEVQASFDRFVNNMTAQRIRVKQVVNMDENWVRPFMTTLVH